ncbi:MAG: Transcriptional regulator [Clostridiaceae bacterium]|jgi:AraC-like DNA-binding protein|nr:Transcriptional regulator [Clostridiaceae bacterium]
MNKQLYISDTKNHFSFEEMVEKVEHIENKTICYYNKNYICGKTIQYEIFDGIWIIYHNLILSISELFPLEEPGMIRMNYCISGRCELNFKNNKVFYVGAGDFVAALIDDKQYKHNFPLGKYKGISIVTNERKLDDFLKTIFVNTKITSSMLIQKIKQYEQYMLLSNNSIVQEIMKEIILFNDKFWMEKSILKFAELILLLINNDKEVNQIKDKYFDKNLTNKVKQIKKEVTQNAEVYITIEEIGKKYNVSSRAFSDCFKEIYGKTYYAFIKEFRIKKAADLLCVTNRSIGEIAIEVGYQNASKFSKAFSDVMGVTPNYFRKNN